MYDKSYTLKIKSPGDHKAKNNDKLLESYQRPNSDFMPNKSNQCNFALKIIQIQQQFKNNQVKTVDKLQLLIQRTNSDFKPN